MATEIRTISFTASASGVTPTSPQFAGVQGDHNAGKVEFTIGDDLQDAAYQYRIEYVDGTGAIDTTAYLTPSSNKVSVLLPQAWTIAGGVAEVRLVVVTLDAQNQAEQILYTLSGRLRYDSHDMTGETLDDTYRSALDKALADVDDATEAANTAASSANAAAASVLQQAQNGDFDGASGVIGADTETAYTGLLKGNGSTVAVATAGMDYVDNATLTTAIAGKADKINFPGIVKSSSTGALSIASQGTDYTAPSDVANSISMHNSSSLAHSSLFAAKQDQILASGILKGNGGTVTVATDGSDYTSPFTVSSMSSSYVANHNMSSTAHSSLFGAKQDAATYGTWTPAFGFASDATVAGTTGTAGTTSATWGRYVKIGKIAICTFMCYKSGTFPSGTTGSSNLLFIANLPFAADVMANVPLPYYTGANMANYVQAFATVNSGSTQLLVRAGNGQTFTNIVRDTIAGQSEVRFSGSFSYITA